jgi:hypothetical protein
MSWSWSRTSARERRLREILDMVRDAGASSILVTDTLALAMKGRYTVALSARRGSILEYPTVVCDHRGPRSVAHRALGARSRDTSSPLRSG